ncbi:AbrB/MazE/SpoVT family DNA-binding domain-containing protein [Paenibacillus glucanolyticus]|uniref:AbrB/MazE/SpoVT family DNA-binding domain-containing protein n=1 Tax=Paenibacillus glucanolyticus TaxID=59843 RepID=UPI0030CBB2CF
MKATGIVRYLDSLGRVVVPKELRRVLDIVDGSPMEIFTDGNAIIIKKYTPGCFICGKTEPENLKPFDSKLICTGCIKSVVELYDR